MTVADVYAKARRSKNQGIAQHLPRLRVLATGLPLAVEFGVRHGASSAALLMGADRVIGVDVMASAGAARLQRIVGSRYDYRIEDSRTVDLPPCDLLFIDSRHTFAQCDAELRAHADKVSRYLVFHDSVTYGRTGEDGGPGILPAIEALLERDPSWRMKVHYPESHGLLVLERAA